MKKCDFTDIIQIAGYNRAPTVTMDYGNTVVLVITLQVCQRPENALDAIDKYYRWQRQAIPRYAKDYDSAMRAVERSRERAIRGED